MTNVLATNAIVPKSAATKYFLKATSNGFPISGQIPRTYQVYTGVGNETINYDGSNEIRIFGQMLTGPLIIEFGPIKNIRNWVGRIVTLNIVAPINRTITLSSPAFLMINGTSLQQFSHVIPADGTSKSITLYFHSTSNINVDYGAAAASVVPGAGAYTFNSLGTGLAVYRDTVGPNVNFRSIDFGDRTHSLTLGANDITFRSSMVWGGNVFEHYNYGNAISEISGGSILMFNPNLAGYTISSAFPVFSNSVGGFSITTPNVSGSNPSLSFEYIPAPRMDRSQTIPLTFTRSGSDLVGGMCLEIIPLMENVFEAENVMCADTSSTALKFYDLDSPGPERSTNIDYSGSVTNVRLDLEPSAICTDLQDNLIFYVPASDLGKIRVASTSRSPFYGVFSEIQIVDSSLIPIMNGTIISDLCYNEVTSTLYALPNKANGVILCIPIMPHLHDSVNFPLCHIGAIRTLRFDSIIPPGGMYSMCLLNNDGDFCISYDDGNTAIGVFRADSPAGFISHSYTYDTGSTGPVSLMRTSKGRIVAQYSSDQRFYATTPGLGISEGFTSLYGASSFYPSLTINCYNYYGA